MSTDDKAPEAAPIPLPLPGPVPSQAQSDFFLRAVSEAAQALIAEGDETRASSILIAALNDVTADDLRRAGVLPGKSAVPLPLPGDAELLALLDEVERLDREAREAPWDQRCISGEGWTVYAVADYDVSPGAILYGSGMYAEANTEFCAFARSALPRLASALRERIRGGGR